MTAIDLNELEVVEQSVVQSGASTTGGVLCGIGCSGWICGLGCGWV